MSTGPPHLGRWSVLDAPLLQYLIARIVFFEPKVATSLLQLNSTFHSATARALYDEVYVQDQEDALRCPPVNSRLETILACPNKYAVYVRTLVLVPVQEVRDILPRDSEDAVISSDSLGQIISLLPSLEAFVWATNRMPIRTISSVLHKACPNITDVAFRPTNSDLAHSYTRSSTQEGLVTTNLQRWDGFMLQSLSNLRSLSISGLSQEGIRELEKLLSHSKRLQHLCVDSQFVDDLLLYQIAHLKQLRSLLIKSSGTKMTDKGILTILESSDTLQDLTLTEVEGRLNKAFWTKATTLPPSLRSVRIAFNEDSPHHSWVSDHLGTIFEVLESAASGLQAFTVTRLMPKGDILPVTWNSQEGMILNNGNGDFEQGMMLKRVFHHACDDVVAPRDLPIGGISRVIDYGSCLQRLEIDFFTLDLDDLKRIVEGCSKLEYLRVLVDAPMPKILGLSSSFVTLTNLHTFVLGITDAHCPQQAFISQPKAKNKGNATSSTPSSPIASRTTRQPPTLSTPLSPAQSEPDPISPTSSPRTPLINVHRRSLSSSAGNVLQNFSVDAQSGMDDFSSAGLQGLRGSVGTFDTSVPPKRDIRKFARRCPSLRIIRWIGRNGKGEWRIAAGTSSIHTHIEFTPIHLMVDEEAEQLTLATGADVEKFIVTRRCTNLPHPGKKIEDIEAATADAVGKEGEARKPRINGRIFPRLKFGAGAVLKAGETKNPAAAEVDSTKKKSIATEQKLTTKDGVDLAVQSMTKLTDSLAVASPKVKTYAAASDPKAPTVNDDARKKSESKMTVLGESNGKKLSRIGSEVAKSSPRPRVDGKAKGSEESTTTTAQSKSPSMTSGAAGRRKRNKAAAAAAASATTQGTNDASTPKRVDRRGTRLTRG